MQRIARLSTTLASTLALAASCSAAPRAPTVEGQLLALVDQVQHVADVSPATAQSIFGVELQQRGRSSVDYAHQGALPDGIPVAVSITAIEHAQPDAMQWALRAPKSALPLKPRRCVVQFQRIERALQARGFSGRRDTKGPWGDPPPPWARGIWRFTRGSTLVVVWEYQLESAPSERCVNTVGVQVDSADPNREYVRPEPPVVP